MDLSLLEDQLGSQLLVYYQVSKTKKTKKHYLLQTNLTKIWWPFEKIKDMSMSPFHNVEWQLSHKKLLTFTFPKKVSLSHDKGRKACTIFSYCLHSCRAVILMISVLYLLLLYGLYVPDWEYQIPIGTSSSSSSAPKTFLVSSHNTLW